jgi:hypothetical protein
VKKLLKILNKIIMGYDIDALMAVKDSFQNQNFQWVKTKDRSKLGKVVKVTDIAPGRNGYVAQLSDGSTIATDRLTSDLLMLMDEQPVLSMTEIMSINYVPGLLDEELQVADTIPADFKQEILSQAKPQVQIDQTPHQVQVRTTSSEPGDLFGMFSLEETDLSLTVSVKLPAKNLLKMMYSNSQDQEQFLNRLASYINNSVTPDSIKDSLKKSLGQDKKKKMDATSAK